MSITYFLKKCRTCKNYACAGTILGRTYNGCKAFNFENYDVINQECDKYQEKYTKTTDQWQTV